MPLGNNSHSPNLHRTTGPADRAVSLAQIAEAGIDVTWYEAVAIVQQICRAMIDGQESPTLDRASVFLQPSGDVTIRAIRFGEESAAVRVLGELLRSWLAATPYPAPLMTVVAQSAYKPPFFTSISELFDALLNYERSNRRDLVRDVYERCRNAPPVSSDAPQDPLAASTSSLQQKLLSLGESARSIGQAFLRNAGERWKRMRARATHTASDDRRPETVSLNEFPSEGAAPKIAPAELSKGQQAEFVSEHTMPRPYLTARLGRRVIYSAGAVIVLLAAAITLTLKIQRHDDRGADSLSNPSGSAPLPHIDAPVPPPSVSASAPPNAPTNAAPNAPATAFPNAPPSAPASAPPNTPASAPPNPRPAVQPPRVTAQIPPSGGASASLPVAEGNRPPATPPAVIAQIPASGPAEPQPVAPERQRAAPSPAPLMPLTPLIIDVTVVYSAENTDVTPPVPIGQHFLTSPPSAAQREGFTAISLVVDETGHVESATVATNPATLREAMFATGNLSAVKAFRFRPAVKGGQPVKYRRTVWLQNR